MPSRPFSFSFAFFAFVAFVAFVLVLGALAAALPGCGSRDSRSPSSSGSSPGSAPGSSPGSALSPIVRIEAAHTDALGETRRTHLGSGFVVSEAGHLVTAFHVMENFRQLVARAPADEQIALVAQPAWLDAQLDAQEGTASAPVEIESWPLQPIAEDPGNDLALLEVASLPGLPAPDGPAMGVARLALAPPAPDIAIELAGYPFGAATLKTRSGRIIVSASALGDASRSLEIPSWFEALSRGGFLLAEVETHRGDSGSPVSRTDSGDVIGLCSAILLLDRTQPTVAGDPNQEQTAPFTLVIPARSIAALLDLHGVAWNAAD